MKKVFYVLLFVLAFSACGSNSKRQMNNSVSYEFNPSILNSEMKPVKMIKGQVVYLPVYSNVPYQIDTIKFNMSAFIAIHNTDLYYPIVLTKVLYFNQAGRLVKDYLKNETIKIDAFATKDFYVPYEDQSGTGANFLIEWKADTLVHEPLIESITTCLKPNNTVAILSQGKILRELK